MMTKTPSLTLLAALLTLAAALGSNRARAQSAFWVATAGDGKVSRVDLVTGTPTPVATGLNMPYGLTFDEHGRLFVSDTFNGAIKEIGADGSLATLASGLSYPSGLSSRCGGLVVAVYGDGCFSSVQLDGSRSALACGFDGALSARPYRNELMASPDLERSLWVWRGSGVGGVDLVRHNPDGTWINQQSIGTGLSYPYDAVPDRGGNMFVSEYGHFRILKFPILSSGAISTNPVVFATGLNPVGLAFGYRGDLYEADFGGAINKFAFSNGMLNTNPIPVVTGLNQPTYLAFPPPPRLRIRWTGGDVMLTWPDAMFTLQTADTLTSGFATVPGATSPYTNGITAGTRFFRLESK